MNKIVCCLWFCMFYAGVVGAQDIDFKQQYFNGKQLYREQKYSLAMETFKQAIQYDANNLFAEYASFFYALSAYQQGYYSVAKDMFLQIEKLYPSWDKREEIAFWMGKIYMEEGDTFQGLKVWSGIKDKKIQQDIEGQKWQYLSKIEDAETLRMMHEEYPKDALIARQLASQLAKNLTDKAEYEELDALIKEFKFDRGMFIHEAPPTYFKEVYSVAAIYPFMLSTLAPTPAKKKNQVILDLYEGMRLALDTLKAKQIDIRLRAYDTKNDLATVRQLLNTEEIKKTDLIIGPFFPDENKLVQAFSSKNKINVIKPFTQNLDMVAGNEFGFLLQPAYETVGTKSAGFLADHVGNKPCMIFAGTTRKDSLLVRSFLQKAREKGLEIASVQMLPRDDTNQIIDMLATPVETDEWNNPVEFTLKKDSLGSIFVASDDALIYSKVISSVETRKDSIVIMGSEAWLEQQALDYEKFQTLGMVLAAPNFTSLSNPYYKAFVKKYLQTHGVMPSSYAKLGYELMLFTGHSLKKYGVYFQDQFSKQDKFPGYLSEGYQYQFSQDNQLVPFIHFQAGELVLIENR